MHTDRSLENLLDVADTLSDRDLTMRVMELLASPPTADADSFVLHAPLELMARAELLPSVAPTHRDEARRRIIEIAVEWAGRSPHHPTPTGPPVIPLPDAVMSGDPDAAERALVSLAATHTIDEFVASAGDTLLTHLGGAGHLPIFLDQLGRRHRAPRVAITAGRALIRDLARHPDWTIGWIDAPPPPTIRDATSFYEVLADPPTAGEPGSNFIYPTMHLVDATGLACELLTAPTQSLPIEEARRQLLRIAALSMLQDDPNNAPYGWSHCLTMPQAALAVAPRTTRPQRAVAVAATYVLGFRATQSNTPLDLDWQPPRPRRRGVLLESDTDDAIAQAWHTDSHEAERELATFAAIHPDAHLAKYTLACLHAASTDPDAAPLFRAAATRLAIWWRDVDTIENTQDDHDDD